MGFATLTPAVPLSHLVESIRDCGFHDQPHPAHEVRAFSGLVPIAWQARRGPHRNQVPLDPVPESTGR